MSAEDRKYKREQLAKEDLSQMTFGSTGAVAARAGFKLNLDPLM